MSNTAYDSYEVDNLDCMYPDDPTSDHVLLHCLDHLELSNVANFIIKYGIENKTEFDMYVKLAEKMANSLGNIYALELMSFYNLIS